MSNQTDTRAALLEIQDEMTNALGNGAFFNPKEFTAVFEGGDNAILSWRNRIHAVLSALPPSSPAETADKMDQRTRLRSHHGLMLNEYGRRCFDAGYAKACSGTPAPPAAPREALGELLKVVEVIEDMRANVADPDDLSTSAIWSWRVDNWADELNDALRTLSQPPSSPPEKEQP